mgnify:CR=1 FL=1
MKKSTKKNLAKLKKELAKFETTLELFELDLRTSQTKKSRNK